VNIFALNNQELVFCNQVLRVRLSHTALMDLQMDRNHLSVSVSKLNLV